jgi:hypothetical protein
MSGLEKQLVPIVFSKGLNTKSNNKIAQPNEQLVDLRNAVFQTTERITKRNGYAALTASIIGGGTIGAGVALANHGGELLLADGTNLYGYSTASTSPGWINKGPLLSPTVTTTPLMSSQYSLAGYDCCVNSAGMACVAAEAWSPAFGTSGTLQGVYYSVIDLSTGSVVTPPTLISSQAYGPKVTLGPQNSFWISYNDPATGAHQISAQGVSQTTGATTFAGVSITNATGTVPTYDSVWDGSTNLWWAFVNNSATNGITVGYRTSSISPFTSTTIAATAAASCVSICFDRSTGNVVVAWYEAGLGVYFSVLSPALAVVQARTLLDNTSNIGKITCVSLSASQVALRFFYSTYDYSDPTRVGNTRTNTVGVAYAVGTSAQLLRNLTVCGKAFQIANVPYVPLAFFAGTPASALVTSPQSTLFIVNGLTGVAVARGYPGNFAGTYVNNQDSARGRSSLPESTLYGSSYVLPAGIVTQFSQTATVNSSIFPVGVQKCAVGALTFTASDSVNGYVATQLAGTTLFSGAVVNSYDGGQSASGAPAAPEHGFFLYPYYLTTSGSAGSGYGYVATYEWTDQTGVVHRSAPSVPLAVTTNTTTLTIPTLKVTQKTASLRGGVRIVVYRTILNGTIYYQANNTGAASDALYNDPTVDTVTWTDPGSDYSANAQLYTTGGVLQNYAPNPLASLIVHRNRVWGIDTTSPLSLWYSKQVVQSTNVAAGSPVEFSAFLTFNVDPKGGGCTALASLDDKLIAFKGDRIFAVTGQGPDSTGGQNDFSDSLLVTGDTGCIYPDSITNAPDGILFQGKKGIYLLDRGLNCRYIGAPVETYVQGGQVCGAQLVPNTNQVRFALSSSQYTLVYDYFVGQWSVFTVDRAQTACAIWNGTYLYLGASGIACTESASGTNYTDPLGRVDMSLKTSWLSLAGYQGFKRIRRMLIEGNAAVIGGSGVSDALSVSIAYNYADNSPPTTQVVTFTPTSNTTGDFQERIRFNVQKCESIQLTVSSQAGGAASSYMDLTAITLEVAAKKGAFKLPATASTG